MKCLSEDLKGAQGCTPLKCRWGSLFFCEVGVEGKKSKLNFLNSMFKILKIQLGTLKQSLIKLCLQEMELLPFLSDTVTFSQSFGLGVFFCLPVCIF